MVDSQVAIAAPVAVLGALSMGLASAAQAHATKQVTTQGALNPKLLLELARRPLWLLGVGGTIGGLVLQLTALRFGALVLVQPILITSLLFATVFSAWLAHRQVDAVIMLGAFLCSAGLAAFLLLARPSAGLAAPSSGAKALPLATVLVVVLAGCVIAARHVRHRARVLLLALSTGLAYGITAALMKVVTALFEGGPSVLFTHPVLYLACLLGPIGFLLSQNTFQEGKLIAPALAVITTVDPLIGVLLGMRWFGEEVTTSPAAIAGQLVAGLGVIGGILLLSKRSEHLTGERHERRTRAATRSARAVPGDPNGMIRSSG